LYKGEFTSEVEMDEEEEKESRLLSLSSLAAFDRKFFTPH